MEITPLDSARRLVASAKLWAPSESSSSETRPVTSSSSSLGGDGEPYVVREKLPYPIGVIVVSEGARDSLVRNEIYEAVKALYGLSANRIKITY